MKEKEAYEKWVSVLDEWILANAEYLKVQKEIRNIFASGNANAGSNPSIELLKRCDLLKKECDRLNELKDQIIKDLDG